MLNLRHGFAVTPEAIAAGVRRTRWPGRLERIRTGGIEWILDVAHNPAGAWSLRAGLRDALGENYPRSWTLVFSCLRDKPLAELAQVLFPLFKQVIFPPIHSPRATPTADLLAAAKATGVPALVAGSVAEALELAQRSPSVNWKLRAPSIRGLIANGWKTTNPNRPPPGGAFFSCSHRHLRFRLPRGRGPRPPYVQYRT